MTGITIEQYRSNPRLREVADRIMERGGIDKKDCSHIEGTEAGFDCTVVCMDADGRCIIEDGDIKWRIVRVTP